MTYVLNSRLAASDLYRNIHRFNKKSSISYDKCYEALNQGITGPHVAGYALNPDVIIFTCDSIDDYYHVIACILLNVQSEYLSTQEKHDINEFIEDILYPSLTDHLAIVAGATGHQNLS
ncbi:MAG: hypothetical protein HPY50_02155 [Firmicutes bacterium]|nr:hypothetical protein [Bacillota bacterium]